jgi:diguanylate cyclase (GGDEF)-like protein
MSSEDDASHLKLGEREAAVLKREDLVKASAVASVTSDAQLREANERLVIATVNAQVMTEVAQRATAQMAFMAEHDYLTGLPNRALLNDRLAQAIALAARHERRVALMYIDLDHFKRINDSLGHSVGDDVLRATAKRLQACVRGSDTVSRQGGDEFVVLLTEVNSAQDAVHTAEKLLKAMSEPLSVGRERLHLSLSIGISLYPDDGADAEAVVRNADTAMYQAKRNGRNRYQEFTAEMQVRAVARQSVEQSLHHAIEHHGFVLQYQPKVNLQTMRITGVEALVRLRHGNEALVGPVEFVGVAEDSGLILPIGNWVLREACRQTVAWLGAGLELGQVAVNVSAVEFHSTDFLPGVRAALHDTGLDPRRLELELTESGLIHDTVLTTEVLRALKDLGVKIAIDDFGTGYSSLSYLRRFPIDTLKIDQSFVQDIGSEAGNPIVSAVIAMGLSLNQRVVAEGIELDTQLAFLRAQRCAEGQGYFFSRPVSADALGAMLRQGPSRALGSTG